MTPEQSLVANALREWKLNVERAEALFSNLDEQQVRSEIAPGRNRLVYLWGHLIAVHDAMLPLLGLGARLHPELDAAFLTAADRTVGDLPTVAELGQLWREVHDRLLAESAPSPPPTGPRSTPRSRTRTSRSTRSETGMPSC